MKLLLPLLLLFIAVGSCAQTNFIKQAKAFYYLRLPGTIPVDEKTNPINRKLDTVATIYLEIKGKKSEWKKAWFNGKLYTVIPSVLPDSVVMVGKKIDSDEKIIIRKAKANTLVTLELIAEKAMASPQAIKKGEILLQGSMNGKTFYYRIHKPIQIASPEFM